MRAIYSHWAVCDERNAVIYDFDGRAEIFDSEERAKRAVVKITEREDCVLHVERVEIR